MYDQPHSMLDSASPLLQRLRQLLLSTGYCDAGIDPTLHEAPLKLPDAGAPRTALNTMIRFLFMCEPCPAEDVAAALYPLTAEQLVEAGIATIDGDEVSSTVRIQPYKRLLFLFDNDTHSAAPEEALMLISPSSLEVAHVMTRHPARSALDIGTGCGFLACVLASFCDTVHAIDVNPAAIRAAEFNAGWNGFSNVHFSSGNLLEPVRGQRFDRIVCNPPFLITPVTDTLSSRYCFKHSGVAGDTFCIELARQASQLLNEDGYFHMIFQWEEPEGQPWSTGLQNSFAGLGCDVWVARLVTVTAEDYVADWVGSLSEEEQSEALTEQARQYFREKKVGTTSTGILTMRRASHRQNHLWFDEAPDDRREPYGGYVSALFAIRSQIELNGDAGLLQMKLRASPNLTLLQTSALNGHAWHASESELSLSQGLKYSFSDVDPVVLGLIANLGDANTPAAVLAKFANEHSCDLALATSTYLPRIRELVWHGFLIPA